MGTLIWTDDFESYTAASPISSPWTTTGNSLVSTGQAHGGTKSLAVAVSGNNCTCTRVLGANYSQWYVDFWMWTNNVGDGPSQAIGLASLSPGLNTVSVNVDQTGAGRVGLRNSTVWFTFSATLQTWHHYLLEVSTAVAGTAKLTLDDTVVGTYSGDTRDSNNASYVAVLEIDGPTIGPGPPAEFYIDDLSVYSGVFVPAGGAQTVRVMVLA